MIDGSIAYGIKLISNAPTDELTLPCNLLFTVNSEYDWLTDLDLENIPNAYDFEIDWKMILFDMLEFQFHTHNEHHCHWSKGNCQR